MRHCYICCWLRDIFDNLSRTLLPPFCSSIIPKDDVHPWDQLHITANTEVLGIFQVICWKSLTLCNPSVVQLDNMNIRTSHQREEELIKARNVAWLTNNLCLVVKDLAARIFRFTNLSCCVCNISLIQQKKKKKVKEKVKKLRIILSFATLADKEF